MTKPTYRRFVTKSKAGHYRLTLVDLRTGLRVTGLGWGSAEQARFEDEARLSACLSERANKIASH